MGPEPPRAACPARTERATARRLCRRAYAVEVILLTTFGCAGPGRARVAARLRAARPRSGRAGARRTGRLFGARPQEGRAHAGLPAGPRPWPGHAPPA
ncbi:hypothetical protein, partial [Streptomyces hainanensis]|uniref:hypothetical protein n=1 Tax=Streptomyces hainanensis TaxID=402648 RepID=UPI001A9D4E80